MVRAPGRERLSAQRPLVAAISGTRGYHGPPPSESPERLSPVPETTRCLWLFPALSRGKDHLDDERLGGSSRLRASSSTRAPCAERRPRPRVSSPRRARRLTGTRRKPSRVEREWRRVMEPAHPASTSETAATSRLAGSHGWYGVIRSTTLRVIPPRLTQGSVRTGHRERRVIARPSRAGVDSAHAGHRTIRNRRSLIAGRGLSGGSPRAAISCLGLRLTSRIGRGRLPSALARVHDESMSEYSVSRTRYGATKSAMNETV